MVRLFLSVFLFVVIAASGSSAQSFVYNLDVASGLPSNHIYGMLVDRNGYLWMATPEGVARYNGYEVRVFDISDGFPINDMWELFEDFKGRIWVLGFAQSLGYIYQDQYREVHIADSTLRLLPESHTIGNHRKGIFLYNKYRSDGHLTLLIEYNDTLYSSPNCIVWPQYHVLGKPDPVGSSGFYPAGEVWYGKSAWRRKGLSHSDAVLLRGNTSKWSWNFNDYLLDYRTAEKQVRICGRDNSSCFEIPLSNAPGNVRLIPGSMIRVNLLADTILYQLKEPFRDIDRELAQSAVPEIPFSSVSWIADGDPWGDCWATAGRGIFFTIGRQSFFEKVSDNMSEYSEVGSDLNGNRYWWNDWQKQLLMLSSDTVRMINRTYRHMPHVKRIVPWTNRHSLLIVSMNGPFLLDHYTRDINSLIKEKNLEGLWERKNISSENLLRLDDFFLKDTNNLYFLSRVYGLVRLDIEKKDISFVAHPSPIVSERGTAYKGIVYDPVLEAVWAYGNSAALMYKPEKEQKKADTFKIWGPFLKGIEKIFIDDVHGNIFVKKSEGLFLVNRMTGIITLLGGSVNTSRSTVLLQGDKLVISGCFGVVFYKITGVGKLSPPVVYTQIRNEYYSNVADMQLIGRSLFLNTNKGLMKCPMPDDDAFRRYTPGDNGNVRLVVKGNTESSVLYGDTILLDSDTRSLQFDIINPAGNGIPRYSYHLLETDGHWYKIGSNELVLPGLLPDHYYTLHVQVSDDAKRFTSILHLYTVPLWWQTVWMKRLMIIAGILALLFLGWITAWITRRVMIQENFKKNLRLEVELKSIYAQINPHFIYNTLNSILLLIRIGNTDSAVYNVSKFSKLLRAYIKSSRNRYITVGEEIENLKNYIELQQVRFGGRFLYNIVIEDKEGGLTEKRIPSLLLQPIVENAINHGLFHKEDTGFLGITFRCAGEGSEIICIIEDDGIGREQSGKINESNTVKAESYGSILIEDLISILNRYEQADIRIEYVDKQHPLTGTIVKLYIK